MGRTDSRKDGHQRGEASEGKRRGEMKSRKEASWEEILASDNWGFESQLCPQGHCDVKRVT